ncbi:MAG TPA: pyridoxal phosphate-dependent aminotransferase [Stellaceae bacterium]|nr:pyridoxal phosphate-dependent aminotransferase [Stellaceae bacterium]
MSEARLRPAPSLIPSPGRPLGIRPAIAALPASKIAEVAAVGFGDPAILPLWFGEGDLPTPAFICEAAAAALKRGETFYTFKRGIPELRQAIAHYLSRLHAKPVGAERVVVTSAGMSAIMLSAQILVEPGDNVVILSPVWPNINASVEAMGGEARAVGLQPTAEGAWRLDLDRLMAACDAATRAVFVNSPSNPTGWMMSREEAAALLDFTRRRGIWLMADEVYERIVYDRPVAASILDLAEPEDRVIVINSFSKSWAMTGWRLGWMVAPEAIHPVLDKLIEFNTSGAPTFLQPAAATALREGEPFVASLVERCRAGRDIIVEGLARFSRIRATAPAGAFYAFFRVDGMSDSLNFAKEIVRRCKVGLAPGAAFGPAGEGYLRLCFASAPERLSEALERLRPMLG